MKKIIFIISLAFGLKAWSISPYIFKVHDYRPAPGQYINVAPEWEEGDSQASMTAKCQEYLAGVKLGSLVSLGAYGGYIIFSFDHPILNKPGDYDLQIYGNAFRNSSSSTGGSAEPGIVMVSADTNGNGIPDDEWYELAGSEYNSPNTLHKYSCTYYHSTGNEDSKTYIRWTSSDPQEPTGYVERNSFHTNNYWPQWIAANELNFSGSRLAKNAYYEGNTFILRFYDWGYVDNKPNNENPGFNLENAVDKTGNPVKLTQVDFIKVYTAINQNCGDLGESSTEILGAEDLHPDYTGVGSTETDRPQVRILGFKNGLLQADNGYPTPLHATVCNMSGTAIMKLTLQPGYTTYSLESLSPGMYLLYCGAERVKILR